MKTDNFDVEITFYSATVAAYIKRECKKKKKKKKECKVNEKERHWYSPKTSHDLPPLWVPKECTHFKQRPFSLLGNHLLLYIHLSSDNES